jgi:hypothetical protein
MIRPVINEIFPSTGILIRNKYVDLFRRDYFINKIYQSGIKNIEIGPYNEHIIEGLTTEISLNNKCIIYPINTNKNVNDSIDTFNKYRESKEGVFSKIILQGNNYKEIPYIYFNTRPDCIEVSRINNIILNTVEKSSKLSLRPYGKDCLKEIDKALIENIYKFSSSLVSYQEHVNTIDLIKYLNSKLWVELTINMSSLKEAQKEIHDDFNW